MNADFRVRALALAAGGAAALALAGCSQTTYGTGISAGQQTIDDFAKAGSLKRQAADIDFKPRPPLVAPPAGAALPAPGSTGAIAGNWPNDPDLQAASVKQQLAAAQASGKKIVIKQTPGSGADQPIIDTNDPANYKTTPEQAAAIKAFKANQANPVDANGNPQRVYLSDPPTDYLAKDPNAPAPTVMVDDNKRTPLIKWPWFKKG